MDYLDNKQGEFLQLNLDAETIKASQKSYVSKQFALTFYKLNQKTMKMEETKRIDIEKPLHIVDSHSEDHD